MTRPAPLVMGVVNVTPDSFSDGGLWDDPKAAIEHGLTLLTQGADILDIGGESTRPGATRPLVEEELARVIPVIEALSSAGAVVSVDTMRSEVARAAVDAGATIVNDVSGGLADPDMLSTVAATEATYIAMHWRSLKTQDLAVYDGPGGVVAAVRRELGERLVAIEEAGIPAGRVVVDPGLGFAKTAEHNWDLLAHLDEIAALGHRVLVGASRKSFLGSLLSRGGEPRAVGDREHATTALSVLLAQRGIWGVRVHDVRSTRDALAVWARIEGPGVEGPAVEGGAP